MIFDSESTFSGATVLDGTRTPQAITATALSQNVLDMRNGAAPNSVDERGPATFVFVQVAQAFNNLTSLTITLESDSASSLAVAPVVHSTLVLPLATLAAGAMFQLRMPSGDYKRYVGMRYTVNGAAPTTGAVIATLSNSMQRNRLFSGSFTVDT